MADHFLQSKLQKEKIENWIYNKYRDSQSMRM